MYLIGGSTNKDIGAASARKLARLCYSCGICVGDCPAARFSEDFNPREIFLKVCLGIGEQLVGVNSPVWKCTTCYTCYERCPAVVKPLDIIIALRNLSFREGTSPAVVSSVRENVVKKGIEGSLTKHIVGLRQKMGLPGTELCDERELELLTYHE
jgi:heterodisulfide reductase subunit C